MSSLPIKRTIGWWAVTSAWTGTLASFLRVDHRRAAGDGAMNRAAIEDHAVDVSLMQPAIELLFRFPLAKNSDALLQRRR
jgi:hypothetical protein